jgi:L-ascorbate metabolism protein UlaG (beta-lactamase superfamily)
MLFRTHSFAKYTIGSIASFLCLTLFGCSLAPQPGEPPHLGLIPDQVIQGQEPFPAMELSTHLDNPDTRSRLEWTVSGPQQLDVTIEGDVAQVVTPAGWTGLETLHFHVCDRWDQCDETGVNFIRFDEDDVVIGFLGVDGFFIAHRGARILIDALIDQSQVSDALITESLLGGESPFNEVDLMLITHIHGDHYEPNDVLQFLRGHPETQVLSTSQVATDLLSLLEVDDPLRERIVAVEFNEGEEVTLTVNQVQLTAFDLPHPGSDNLENHGFMLHLGDLNLLHTGDLNFNFNSIDTYPFSGYPVDYAFLPTIMVDDRTHSLIQDWLGDGDLIPMHYRFSGSYAGVSAIELQEIRELFPDCIYFTHELQYWLGP